MGPLKRQRNWINRTVQRIEDAPARLFTGDRPITASAKQELYDKGVAGQALVIKAPAETFVDSTKDSTGPFTVRVELPGRDAYEAKFWHAFDREEWQKMQPGALLSCRVDPENPQRVLLLAPAWNEGSLTVAGSSEVLAEGKRATATVLKMGSLGKTAPGTKDPLYVMDLELRSDAEPEPWKVQIGARVPKGAVDLIANGSELQVAYMEVDEGNSVAVDWPASSGGRFS